MKRRRNQWSIIYGLIIFLIRLNCYLCLALRNPKSTFGEAETSLSASDGSSTESRSAGDDSDEEEEEEDGSGDGDDDEAAAVESERKTGVVVAAVPVVLGLVTVILLCFLMICRRNQRHKTKWSSRQPQICMSSVGVDCSVSDVSSSRNSSCYVETYVVEEEMADSAPTTPTDAAERCVPAVTSSRCPTEDPPPSYEEVMRSELYRKTNHSIAATPTHPPPSYYQLPT